MSVTIQTDIHNKLSELTGQKTCSCTRRIKPKDGTLILEKDKYFRDGTNTSERENTTGNT